MPIDIEIVRESKEYRDKPLKDVPDSELLQLIGAAISINNRNITPGVQLLLLEAEYRYDNDKFVPEKEIDFLKAELNDKQAEIERLREELFKQHTEQNNTIQNPICRDPFNINMKVTGFNVS